MIKYRFDLCIYVVNDAFDGKYTEAQCVRCYLLTAQFRLKVNIYAEDGSTFQNLFYQIPDCFVYLSLCLVYIVHLLYRFNLSYTK